MVLSDAKYSSLINFTASILSTVPKCLIIFLQVFIEGIEDCRRTIKMARIKDWNEKINHFPTVERKKKNKVIRTRDFAN